jgi:GTP-binding protein
VRIDAAFVTSAASAGDFPRDGLAEIALVGRSNVGKSSLINALVRGRLARTSAAPGKTRLANVYRVNRGGAPPFHLVDLPGYGYARGGSASADVFEALTRAYFGRARTGRDRREGEDRRERQHGIDHPAPPAPPAFPAPPARVSALLLVDARHPGLQSDVDAWRWLRQAAGRCGLVATKIDKLARGERIRAMRQLESVCETSVVPVSAATGEGLDELWRMIDRLNNPAETAPQPRLPNERPSGLRTKLRKR